MVRHPTATPQGQDVSQRIKHPSFRSIGVSNVRLTIPPCSPGPRTASWDPATSFPWSLVPVEWWIRWIWWLASWMTQSIWMFSNKNNFAAAPPATASPASRRAPILNCGPVSVLGAKNCGPRVAVKVRIFVSICWSLGYTIFALVS